MRALDVMLTGRGVGLGDANESDIGVRGEVVQKAANVPMDEADDRNANGRGLRGGGEGEDKGEGEERAADDD
jgi:hypothetical protein